jgi:K+-transporting ATPase A subunit
VASAGGAASGRLEYQKRCGVNASAAVVGTALIVGGLCYFPALVLGPVIEHLLMK